MSKQIAEDALAHYGVKGMKWGVRRNEDGSIDKSDLAKKGAIAAAVVLSVGVTVAATHNTAVARAGAKATEELLKDSFSYRIADGPWLTTLPRTSASVAFRGLKPR